MIALAGVFLVAAALIALMYRRLRVAQFSVGVSSVIVTLAALQMATAATTAVLAAVVLAAVLYMICVSALEFVDRQNVRNVILLGSSLALVQTANPLGSIVAATLLPMIIVSRPHGETRMSGGALMVLLLFIPVSSAVVIAYAARTLHLQFPLVLGIGPEGYLRGARLFAQPDPLWTGIVHALFVVAIGLPVWFAVAAARTRRAVAIAAVAGAVVAAMLVAGLLGRDHPLGLVAPALAMLSVMAIGEAPRGMGHERRAIFLNGIACLFAWTGGVLT